MSDIQYATLRDFLESRITATFQGYSSIKTALGELATGVEQKDSSLAFGGLVHLATSITEDNALRNLHVEDFTIRDMPLISYGTLVAHVSEYFARQGFKPEETQLGVQALNSHHAFRVTLTFLPEEHHCHVTVFDLQQPYVWYSKKGLSKN